MYSRVRALVLIAAVLAAGAFYWTKTNGPSKDAQALQGTDMAETEQPSSRARAATSSSPSKTPAGAETPLVGGKGEAEATAATTDSLASLSPLRRPIIQAIRASGQSPAEKREAMVRAVEASGVSDEPWTDEAPSTFQSWRGAMPKIIERGIDVGAPSCFRAGCLVQVRFPNELAYREAAAAFRSLAEGDSEHGGRVQTPPATVNGAIVANWIMLRPEHDSDEEDGV